ncbi:MAG: methionyl-tRNA formyltransferase [Thermodesulfobacteriota bacterium]
MKTFSDSLKVVFMGTPEFAVPSLKAMIEAGADVRAVVTQPTRPSGRGLSAKDSPVKTLALEHKLPVLEPLTIKGEGFINELKALGPDLIAVVAYGRILPRAVLDLPRLGCVNLHASLLPAYRGAAPVNWAVINGEAKTGVSTMLMDEGMDTGAVLLTEEIEIGEDETTGEVLEKLSGLGAALLVKTIGLLQEGKLTPEPQDDTKATYAPLLKKEDGRVDWTKSPEEIRNRLRGLKPWPGTYSYWNGKLLKIHGARVSTGVDGKAAPGVVISAAADGIVVKCGSGALKVTELQLEGKRRMSAAEFLRGHSLGEGESFGKE